MTNFDPGRLLVLFTVIPSVVVGVVAILLAHFASYFGYGEYDRNFVVFLGLVGGVLGLLLLFS